MRFAAIGLDHRHIFHMVGGLIDAGAVCAGFDRQTSDDRVLTGFRERFPALSEAPREALFADPGIDLIVCAAVPSDRPALAVSAMRAGKHVMVDKPGVISVGGLADVERTAAETGRLFSICFSERFIVPSTIVAGKLIADGAIGRVVQTIGLGPHRLNGAIRPGWFFDRACHGGILNDIASHQIDQFLHFTGSSDATIVAAGTGHFGDATPADFEDFGEVLLRSDHAGGYVRVDWFTADGLPTWGDGRLTILGTDGTIELRKYVDIAGRAGTDHLFLVDRAGTQHIDASKEPLTYFRDLMRDIEDGGRAAMHHAFTVSRLALEAQRVAARLPEFRR